MGCSCGSCTPESRIQKTYIIIHLPSSTISLTARMAKIRRNHKVPQIRSSVVLSKILGVLVTCPRAVVVPFMLFENLGFKGPLGTGMLDVASCCRDFPMLDAANAFRGPHARLVNLGSPSSTALATKWYLYMARTFLVRKRANGAVSRRSCFMKTKAQV